MAGCKPPRVVLVAELPPLISESDESTGRRPNQQRTALSRTKRPRARCRGCGLDCRISHGLRRDPAVGGVQVLRTRWDRIGVCAAALPFYLSRTGLAAGLAGGRAVS